MIAYGGAMFLKESVIHDGVLSLRGRLISYEGGTLERFPWIGVHGKGTLDRFPTNGRHCPADCPCGRLAVDRGVPPAISDGGLRTRPIDIQ